MSLIDNITEKKGPRYRSIVCEVECFLNIENCRQFKARCIFSEQTRDHGVVSTAAQNL